MAGAPDDHACDRLSLSLGLDGDEGTIGGVRCADLADRCGTPVFVMDKGRLRDSEGFEDLVRG